MRNEFQGLTGQVDVTSGKDEATKPEKRKRLGDNLRQLYDDVVNEPVPQEMLELLARLREQPPKK